MRISLAEIIFCGIVLLYTVILNIKTYYMKKFNLILGNIPHFSGVYLAKHLTKPIVIVAAIANLIVFIFLRNEENLIRDTLIWTVVSIVTLFLFGYWAGKHNIPDKLRYLNSLRERHAKKIKSLETIHVDPHVKAEIQKMEESIRFFFNPLVLGFVQIETKKKGSLTCFKKSMDAFEKAMKNTRDPTIKKAGLFLEYELYYPIFDAICDKKQFLFDPSWMEKVDLIEEKKEIQKKISSKFLLERLELSKRIREIDDHIFLYSYKKSFSALN